METQQQQQQRTRQTERLGRLHRQMDAHRRDCRICGCQNIHHHHGTSGCEDGTRMVAKINALTKTLRLRPEDMPPDYWDR